MAHPFPSAPAPEPRFTLQQLRAAFVAGACWAEDGYDPDVDGPLTEAAEEAAAWEYPDPRDGRAGDVSFDWAAAFGGSR